MAKKAVVGIVTIGHTPREDLMYEMRKALGPNIELTMCGALDEFTVAEAKKLIPKPGDQVLLVKLRDGSPMDIAKRHIAPGIQKCIDRFADSDVDLIVIACVGIFPEFKSKKLVVEPSKLLYNVTMGLMSEGRLGIIVPTSKQIQEVAEKWSRDRIDLYVLSASPWKEAEVSDAVEKLKKLDVDMIVLDCYGFNDVAKQRIKRETGKLVIAPPTLTAGVVRELLR